MKFQLSGILTNSISTARKSFEHNCHNVPIIIPHTVASVGIVLNLKQNPCKHCYSKQSRGFFVKTNTNFTTIPGLPFSDPVIKEAIRQLNLHDSEINLQTLSTLASIITRILWLEIGKVGWINNYLSKKSCSNHPIDCG